MEFKTRQIRKRPPLKPFKKAKQLGGRLAQVFKNLHPKTKNVLIAGALAIFGVFVVIRVMGAVYNYVSNFSFKDLVFSVGAELKKDEHGYTNILLLGDGGHTRDGADLVDSIMVASIDYQKNAITLFSVPRDLYITPDKERGILFGGKINEVYRNHKLVIPDEDGRWQVFKKAVGKVVNLNIQYYIRLDFHAFVEVVDSLGGITVDVQKDIYDPFYPNNEDDGYTIFSIKKGVQQLDGETTLKFVRSRETTSDFDRSARQQQVIEAIQQKALSENLLSNPGLLLKLYRAINKNMNTDMSTREMLSLAGFAKHMDRSRLVRKGIHDDPGREGGFLYTPDRTLYDNAFVLVPIGDNYDAIHKYCDLIFNRREMYYDPAKIEILNATKLSGIARNLASELNRFGFEIGPIDNYLGPDGKKTTLQSSMIEYHDYTEDAQNLATPKFASTLDALEEFFQAPEKPGKAYLAGEEGGKKTYESGGMNISVVLGQDYKDILAK